MHTQLYYKHEPVSIPAGQDGSQSYCPGRDPVSVLTHISDCVLGLCGAGSRVRLIVQASGASNRRVRARVRVLESGISCRPGRVGEYTQVPARPGPCLRTDTNFRTHATAPRSG